MGKNGENDPVCFVFFFSSVPPDLTLDTFKMMSISHIKDTWFAFLKYTFVMQKHFEPHTSHHVHLLVMANEREHCISWYVSLQIKPSCLRHCTDSVVKYRRRRETNIWKWSSTCSLFILISWCCFEFQKLYQEVIIWCDKSLQKWQEL